MLTSLRQLWAALRGGAPAPSDELKKDVRSALADAERHVARFVAAGGGEYTPLLADIRALASRPIGTSLLKAVEALSDAFPYRQDKFETWIRRSDRTFLARLREAGAGYADEDPALGRGLDVLHELRYRVALALRLAAHAGPRASARLPGERIVDVGPHRLHFFEPADGGGFVIDDGWYVPVGYARSAALATGARDHDYVLVDTVACPETRSSGGLCLVDVKERRFSRLTTEPAPLDRVSFFPDGLRDGDGPLVPYTSLSFTPCALR